MGFLWIVDLDALITL